MSDFLQPVRPVGERVFFLDGVPKPGNTAKVSSGVVQSFCPVTGDHELTHWMRPFKPCELYPSYAAAMDAYRERYRKRERGVRMKDRRKAVARNCECGYPMMDEHICMAGHVVRPPNETK